MTFIDCYTLDGERLSRGIGSDAFDCFVVGDDSAGGTVSTAYIRAFPVVDTDRLKLRDLAPLSLSFVYDAGDGAEPSGAGILLSVKASEWGVATTDTSRTVLMAPGSSGRVLLFINAATPHALVSCRDSRMVLSVSDKAEPCVRKTGRGQLFAAAAAASAGRRQVTVSP